MANTRVIKIVLPFKNVEKIDELVTNGDYASRADFCQKAAFLLLVSIDGTLDEVKKGISEREGTRA